MKDIQITSPTPAQKLDITEGAETRKKSFGKKSKLNKLRGLKFDGKKEE